MQYRQVQTIGAGAFARTLRGIVIDRRDRIYAVGDSAVKIFNSSGELRRHWVTSRPGWSVALTGDGTAYVGQAGQVEIFDGAGKLSATWRDQERLGLVTAIGFVNGSVLLADAKARCIRRYDKNGEFIQNIGDNNRRKGFLIPNGVVDFSVDPEGIIHATNPGKHRVERYTPEGELLGHIGRFDGLNPAGFPGCCNPTNVAVAGPDRIYVSEKAGPRAKVYDFDGNLLSVIATDVFDPNCKNMDIAVDSRGRVCVADTVKLQICVFEPTESGT